MKKWRTMIEPHAPGIDVVLTLRGRRKPKARYYFYGSRVSKRTAQAIQDAWRRVWTELGDDEAMRCWAEPKRFPWMVDPQWPNKRIVAL